VVCGQGQINAQDRIAATQIALQNITTLNQHIEMLEAERGLFWRARWISDWCKTPQEIFRDAGTRITVNHTNHALSEYSERMEQIEDIIEKITVAENRQWRFPGAIQTRTEMKLALVKPKLACSSAHLVVNLASIANTNLSETVTPLPEDDQVKCRGINLDSAVEVVHSKQLKFDALILPEISRCIAIVRTSEHEVGL
jgi:hypothetical protein